MELPSIPSARASQREGAAPKPPTSPTARQQPPARADGRASGEPPSERLLLANYRLFKASQEAGYDALIREASELFSAPVVYVDEYFQIRSRYPKRTDDAAPHAPDEHPDVLPERLWNIFNESLMGADRFYEPFYSDTGLCADTPCLFGVVARMNEARGHVIVQLGEVPFLPEDLEIMSILTELLRAKLERRSFWLDNRTAKLTSALQLLVAPDTPERRVQQSVATLGEALRPGYQVMVSVFERVPTQQVLAEYTAREARRYFPDTVSTVFDGSVVTLIPALPSERWMEAHEHPVVKRFIGYMERFQLASGLSGIFDDLSQTRSHFRQALLTARMVLRLGAPSPASYRDYAPYCLTSALLETEQAETFIHPVLPSMAAYDAEHGTPYFETLRAYLLQTRDKARAARVLGVHKNTLVYRLGKIEELFDVVLDSPNDVIQLTLSFLIWDVKAV